MDSEVKCEEKVEEKHFLEEEPKEENL